MERRDFLAFLALTGCGGEMEYQIQPSPRLRSSTNTFPIGVFGRWTPGITFAIPGNLSVSYATQTGFSLRIGEIVHLYFNIVTLSFTHTTASDDLTITGVPFTFLADSGMGSVRFQGITKAGYTNFTPNIGSGATLLVSASGSGQSLSTVLASNMPTGGTVILEGSLTLFATTLFT